MEAAPGTLTCWLVLMEFQWTDTSGLVGVQLGDLVCKGRPARASSSSKIHQLHDFNLYHNFATTASQTPILRTTNCST